MPFSAIAALAKVLCKNDACGNRVEESYSGVNREPVLNEDSFSIKRTDYDKCGFVQKESYYDTLGAPCNTGKGFSSCSYKRNQLGILTDELYFGKNSEPCFCKDLYHHKTIIVDAFGKTCMEDFFDVENKPCLTSEWAHRKIYQYNESGLLRKVLFFDTDLNPCYNNEGYHMACYAYDESENITKVNYFDIKGNACYDRNGVSCIEREYDAYHNCTKETYLGEDGLPCCCHSLHAATILREYDKHRNLLSERYLGTRGQAAADDDGIHKREWSYSNRGLLRSVTYRSVEGDYWWNNQGISREIMEYNDLGQMIKKTSDTLNKGTFAKKHTEHYTYDALGRCVAVLYQTAHNGNELSAFRKEHVTVFEYDERGNVTQQRFFNAEKQSLADDFGVCEQHFVYDEQNRKIMESCSDVNGQPVPGPEAYARKRIAYDERGFVTGITYFGADGQPCLNREGYASCSILRSRRGLAVHTQFYGIDGHPVSINGYEVMHEQYDAKGRSVKVQFFDRLNNPVTARDSGAAYFTKSYNSRWCRTSEKYFDREHCPCTNKITGTHAVEFKYYTTRRLESVSYKDENDKLSECSDGYARVVLFYNPFGNIKSELYYGSDGKLCNNRMGYARRLISHSRKSETVLGYKIVPSQTLQRERYYDAAGLLCTQHDSFEICADDYICNNQHRILLSGISSLAKCWSGYEPASHAGYAYRVDVFDEDGNITSEEFRDVRGNLRNKFGYAKKLIRYELGKMVEESFYDEKNNPSEYYGHYSKKRISWDDKGKVLSEAFYDINDTICCAKHFEYARKIYTYDDFGKIIMEKTYDANGCLCLSRRGYACLLYQYNKQGNLTEKEYLDAEGNPCLCVDGYARVMLTYNAEGNLTCKEFLDLNHHLARNIRLSAPRIIYQHDENNRIIKEERHRYDGSLCSPVKVYTYSQNGKCAMIEQFNEDGSPYEAVNEYYKIAYSYDERGNRLSSKIFDAKGHLFMDDACGLACIKYEYDSRNNCVSQSTYNEQGKPCINKLFKAHRKMMQYDESGHLICVEYRDCSDHLCMGYDEKESYPVARSVYRYDKQGYLAEERHYDTQRKPFCISDKTGSKTGVRGLRYAGVEYSWLPGNEAGEPRYYDAKGNVCKK